MNERDAIKALVLGIQSDLVDYAQLETLLEQQFRAALVPNAARMADVSATIFSLCETLEQRRRERSRLTRALGGVSGAEAMPAIFARLPEALANRCREGWQRLQRHVLQCQALNQRNGELMTAQQQLLERVLFGEASATYAPQGDAA